jgi:hypothetical protein
MYGMGQITTITKLVQELIFIGLKLPEKNILNSAYYLNKEKR